MAEVSLNQDLSLPVLMEQWLHNSKTYQQNIFNETQYIYDTSVGKSMLPLNS